MMSETRWSPGQRHKGRAVVTCSDVGGEYSNHDNKEKRLSRDDRNFYCYVSFLVLLLSLYSPESLLILYLKARCGGSAKLLVHRAGQCKQSPNVSPLPQHPKWQTRMKKVG